MWRFYRAWLVARASGCISLAVWGATRRLGLGSLPATLEVCSLCEAREVGLSHFLESCPAFLLQRQNLPQQVLPVAARWVLQHLDPFEILAVKARFFGLCLSALVHSL